MPDLIVVDVETTGLDTARHVPIEIAAVNVSTGESLYFVPYLDPADLGTADGGALRVNRYFERGLYDEALSLGDTQDRYHRLWKMLKRNTFGAANARFDAGMLCHGRGRLSGSGGRNGSYGTFTYEPAEESWHYRLADLGSYAAALLHLDPAEIPSLRDVCHLLGVTRDAAEEHTALGDARAAAECFRRLRDRSLARVAAATEARN